MITNINWSSCKVPFVLVRFKWNLNFLDIFSKNTQISNFMKIRPVGAEKFHDEVTPLNFANAPKNGSILHSVS